MQKFRTIHTLAGLIKLNALRRGGSLELSQIAFGDGNGNPVEPSEGATGLVRECYRCPINRVYADPENPLMYYAEAIIPASAGGFVIREICAFDGDGEMFVVGNTPDNYIPKPEEGAVGDGIYTLAFAVGNAGDVKIILDPNSVVASRKWVMSVTNSATVLPGGTTGQVARKLSNQDGDIGWGDLGEVNVLVSTIEERQSLAEGQRAVILAVTTTVGLAIYINGERISRGAAIDEWLPDADDPTKLMLGQPYPGARLIAAQNEPAGNIGNPLERSANLADVPNKVEARRNLGVVSAEETRQMAPAGMIGTFAGSNAPTGWLKANGAQVAKDAYPALYAAVGDLYTPAGQSPSAGSFFLPDLRGLFPRFWDDGRGNDAGRSLGSNQGDQLAAHAHSGRTSEAGDHEHDSSFGEGNKHTAAAPYGMSPHRPGNRNAGSSGGVDYDNYAWQTSTDGRHAHDFTTGVTGGNETRPKNVALLACIKY
ncbi:phage tail protein [Stenotrophomonas sp. SAU14A_NAIMI4_5]|uniref:phage tail-collar fiber domain-containing protein n=1 Tax=Stenotrophomonas sp. SAU14A_NAIMI4_5 TaxID=2072413 RepID=UPI000D541271|nr:phage tail protein [Stenotrophomonas sp. SAU14A_NAIMI4_5]AWH47943.1 phage tail protein [Stenotrophomonas sp. SAU14A_NAIMI4_5]